MVFSSINTLAINYSLVIGLHRRVSAGHYNWHRPQHQHRLQLPPHSCRSNLLSLRTRLACLWTPPRRHQPSPTQPQDASNLAAPHSAFTTDASTQLPISDFLQVSFSEDLSRRTVPLLIHGNVSHVVPATSVVTAAPFESLTA